jgi:hypothetical protein
LGHTTFVEVLETLFIIDLNDLLTASTGACNIDLRNSKKQCEKMHKEVRTISRVRWISSCNSTSDSRASGQLAVASFLVGEVSSHPLIELQIVDAMLSIAAEIHRPPHKLATILRHTFIVQLYLFLTYFNSYNVVVPRDATMVDDAKAGRQHALAQL